MSTPFDSWNSLCATTSEYYHTNCYARSPNALIAVEHLVKTQRIIKLPCLQLHNDCFHTLFMRPSGATVPILAIWFANCQSTRDTFTALHFEMIIANCQSTFARFFIVLCIMNRSSCLCYALQRFFYKGGERMRWIFFCILEPFLPVLCTAAFFLQRRRADEVDISLHFGTVLACAMHCSSFLQRRRADEVDNSLRFGTVLAGAMHCSFFLQKRRADEVDISLHSEIIHARDLYCSSF